MDKLCMTLGWLVGRRIAAQRACAEEPWQLLFEGDVTTAPDGERDCTCGMFQPMLINPYPFDNADTERVYTLTVDGVSVTQVVGIREKGYTPAYDAYYIGNMALWDSTSADDGTDFCLLVPGYDQIPAVYVPDSIFVSREAGTYHVKVERLLKDPVAYSYGGVRLPALPGSGNACILTSESGAARLLYPSGTEWFDYSAELEAFVSPHAATTVVCYTAQPDGEWVRQTDMELAAGESLPLPGEELIWANWTVLWHPDPDNGWSKETVLEASRAMPIFDYKEW